MFFVLAFTALASPVTKESVSTAEPLHQSAEYVRLSRELHELCALNAWQGVERVFLQIEATEITPTYEVLIAGAHAARAMGDTARSRVRLQQALMLREDPELVEWIQDIDNRYGSVFIACKDTRKRAAFEISELPFRPMLRRSIEHAQEAIASDCYFDGLLPEGAYTLTLPDGWSTTLRVVPKAASLNIDLRTTNNRSSKAKPKRSR
jgi:hypothetical protein